MSDVDPAERLRRRVFRARGGAKASLRLVPGLLLLLLGVASAGCSTTRIADLDAAGVDALNARAEGERVTVVLADTRRVTARRLTVSADTVRWFTPRLGTYAVPAPYVRALSFSDGRRGTRQGALLGLATGALAGVAIGLADGDDDPSQWFAFTAGQKALLGGASLGALGAALGAVLGSGSREVYRLRHAPGAAPEAPVDFRRFLAVDTAAAGGRDRGLLLPPGPSYGGTWLVSGLYGGTVGAPSALEDALIDEQFDDRDVCWFFCFDDLDYPRSTQAGVSWMLSVYRRTRGRLAFGAVAGATGRLETTGRHESLGYLYIEHRQWTVAPLVAIEADEAVRLGFGPALHVVRVAETSTGDDDARRHTRPGFVVDLNVTFPQHTRLFVDIRAQYRWVGKVEVGPFEKAFPGEVSYVFPERDVAFNHLLFGIGLGVRF